MENKNLSDQEKTKQENVTISKKTIYIVLAILAVVLIIIAFIFFYNRKISDKAIKKGKDSTFVAKKDSVVVSKDSAKIKVEYGEEEGSPFTQYRVISNSLNLPQAKLKFGDKVFVDDSKSNEVNKIIYLENPDINPNAPSYSIGANAFIEDYRFEDYKNNFSLSPFSELASGVKKILLEKNYDDGKQYYVTQNAERARSSVAFGDFDGDGIKDVAVLMDNNEKQICRLVVICTNIATKQPYVAFAESFSDKIRINGFKKSTPIRKGEEVIESPQDGIMIKGDGYVNAIVYDSDLQKFRDFSEE